MGHSGECPGCQGCTGKPDFAEGGPLTIETAKHETELGASISELQ